MFRHWSLKKKFVIVFLLLITLPTILFGTLISYQATKAFENQAKDNITSQLEKNDENLRAIIRGIENMSSYMIYENHFRTFFTTNPEEVTRIREAEEVIKGYLTFQIMTYDYINSIELTGKTGNVLPFGNPVTGEELDLEEQALNKQGAPFWSNGYQIMSDWSGERRVVSLIRVINDINKISEPIGTLKIRLDESQLYKAIEVNQAQKGQYFVLSETGEVVLHQDSSMVGNPFPDSAVIDLVLNSESNTSRYETNGDAFLLVKKEVQGTNWFSVVMINQNDVVSGLYSVRTLIVNMIILLAVLGVIAFIGFYYYHIKPIVELTEQTKKLENGNFSANVKVNSKDEVGQLGLRFNHMVGTIQKYIDIEYKLKIKQKESELKALQNQIDPHFLYNTLDMIRWTARIENALETGQLIERLSKIFRMNLNRGKMWVTVEEEMTYLYNYLELQRSRMGNRLKFTIYYDDQMKHTLLMKQLLQPLVENSILHGFKDLPRPGEINIRCYQVNQELWVDVIDNGWGFPGTKEIMEYDSKSGYALTNLKERMQIAFGEGFGIEIVDAEQGAWIRLKLPQLDEGTIT